jgi:hypothetical protein
VARQPTAAQDDARENRLVDIFNLVRPENRARHGTDAVLPIDGHELEFELKSITRKRGGISTVRDLGPDHVARWRNKHWIIAFFDGNDISDCRYGTPDQMSPWIAKIWEYVRTDFELAALAPALINRELMERLLGSKKMYTLADAKGLQKKQHTSTEYNEMMDLKAGYSPERMLEILRSRAKYLLERGATLNNPHIPQNFFADWTQINNNHAARLRRHVRRWLSSKRPEQLALNGTP